MKFFTREYKNIFFRKLAAKKPHADSESLLAKLRVVDEVLAFLIEDYKRAETHAYNIRKENRGTKTRTRIDCRNQKIVLSIKKAEELKYSDLKIIPYNSYGSMPSKLSSNLL